MSILLWFVSMNYTQFEVIAGDRFKTLNQRLQRAPHLPIAPSSTNDRWATFDLLHDPFLLDNQYFQKTEVSAMLLCCDLFHWRKRQNDYQLIMKIIIHTLTYENHLFTVSFCPTPSPPHLPETELV